jgi:DNA-binding transcriptional ArsR family regulator
MEDMQTITIPNMNPLNFKQVSKTVALFSAFADETRLKILFLLLNGSLTVNEIQAKLDISLPAVSYQLKMLRERDLVRYIKRGREKHFQIADIHVVHLLNDGLTHAAGVGLCNGEISCEISHSNNNLGDDLK